MRSLDNIVHVNIFKHRRGRAGKTQQISNGMNHSFELDFHFRKYFLARIICR